MEFFIETEEVCAVFYKVNADSEESARSKFDKGLVTKPLFSEAKDVEIKRVVEAEKEFG